VPELPQASRAILIMPRAVSLPCPLVLLVDQHERRILRRQQLIIEGRARSDAGRSVCSNHPSRLRASKRGFDRAGSVSVRL